MTVMRSPSPGEVVEVVSEASKETLGDVLVKVQGSGKFKLLDAAGQDQALRDAVKIAFVNHGIEQTIVSACPIERAAGAQKFAACFAALFIHTQEDEHILGVQHLDPTLKALGHTFMEELYNDARKRSLKTAPIVVPYSPTLKNKKLDRRVKQAARKSVQAFRDVTAYIDVVSKVLGETTWIGGEPLRVIGQNWKINSHNWAPPDDPFNTMKQAAGKEEFEHAFHSCKMLTFLTSKLDALRAETPDITKGANYNVIRDAIDKVFVYALLSFGNTFVKEKDGAPRQHKIPIANVVAIFQHDFGLADLTSPLKNQGFVIEHGEKVCEKTFSMATRRHIADVISQAGSFLIKVSSASKKVPLERLLLNFYQLYNVMGYTANEFADAQTKHLSPLGIDSIVTAMGRQGEYQRFTAPLLFQNPYAALGVSEPIGGLLTTEIGELLKSKSEKPLVKPDSPRWQQVKPGDYAKQKKMRRKSTLALGRPQTGAQMAEDERAMLRKIRTRRQRASVANLTTAPMAEKEAKPEWREKPSQG
jgi:hypothetical protein